MIQINPALATSARVSVLMRQLLDEAVGTEAIKLGDILELFGTRGFALLILVLSLLNILVFMVPLVSILFGLPVILLAGQMILGLKAPYFPAVLRQREIHRHAFVAGLEKAIYWVQKLEYFVKPRLLFLSHPYLYRLHGVLVLALAIMVTIPIPIFNSFPSVALALLSIGLLQRDGFFMIASYVIAFGCLAVFKVIAGHLSHGLGF